MAAYRVPLKLNLKQSYPRILNPRPLPEKPIRFSCSASTPLPKFKVDVILQCLLSKKQNQYLTTAADSISGGHNASLLPYSPQWLLNLIKDKWPAAANPNMKKNLCETLKKRAMAAVVFLGLLLIYNNSKPALAVPVGRVGASSTVRQISIAKYGITTSSSDTYSTCDHVLCYFLCYIVVAVSVTGVWLGLLGEWNYDYCIAFCVFLLAPLFIYNGWLSGRTSVVKVQLQYGLSRKGVQALQMDLNRIAETADTSTRKGLSNVLTESVIALLRHQDCYISGYLSALPTYSGLCAQGYLKHIYFKERVKLETLVDVDNVKLQNSTTQRSTKEFHDEENIMVILLVAVDGVYEFPSDISTDDLEKVLQKLESINLGGELLGIEVLWIPQFSSSTTSTWNLLMRCISS